MTEKLYKRVENTVEKGEIARYKGLFEKRLKANESNKSSDLPYRMV